MNKNSILCCFGLMTCVLSMQLMHAASEPAGWPTDETQDFSAKYEHAVYDMTDAIIHNKKEVITNTFIDIFNGAFLRCGDKSNYFRIAVSLGKSVRRMLQDRGHYQLLTCFENEASKTFNDIVENCKRCLSESEPVDSGEQEVRAPREDSPTASRSTKPKLASWSMKLRAAFFELQGLRDAMEDTHDIYQRDDERFAYYAVYDGHCGKGVSIFAREHLRKYILQAIAYIKNPTHEQILCAMRDAFTCVEKEITDSAGSTAIVILIDKQERILYCGNLGDSRAVLSANGSALQLSQDHNAREAKEADRLLKAGGIIIEKRLVLPASCDWLAVSRSFGDKRFKSTKKLAEVMSEPEFTIRLIEPTDDFLIIACDGVWDVMKNQEAADFVAKGLKASHGDVTSVSRDLVNHAIYHRHSFDNVTAIIVTFH